MLGGPWSFSDFGFSKLFKPLINDESNKWRCFMFMSRLYGIFIPKTKKTLENQMINKGLRTRGGT